MYPVRLLVGSVVVYLTVATIHACGPSVAVSASAAPNGASGIGGVGASTGTASGSDGAGGSSGNVLDPIGDAHANESGSRLKARWYKGIDGSKEWLGWYDNRRGEDCLYAIASDGVTRCLPEKHVYLASAYADENCVVPLANVGSGCQVGSDLAKYAIETNPPICPDQTATYSYLTITGKFNGDEYYNKSLSGKCSKTPVPPGFTYATVGSEVPPSEFVEASIVVE